jgi:hypothetical protein
MQIAFSSSLLTYIAIYGWGPEFIKHVDRIDIFYLFLAEFTYQMSIIVFLLIKKYIYFCANSVLLGVVLGLKLNKILWEFRGGGIPKRAL